MCEYDAIQKSKHWKSFDARSHLYKEENLEDFRNNELSRGLDDQYSPQKQQEIFQDLINEVGEDFVLSNLTENNIGNSHQFFKVGGKFVDGGQNIHIKWLHDLESFVFSKGKIKYIYEIGGGYGSLAQKIRLRHDCKYILIDLPEANILSSYYLTHHFPNLKFLLCDEIEGRSVSKEDIDGYDFIILPPWYEINGVKIDLFINTRSMMEMNLKVIKKYFDFIHNNIANGGFFLNINRYRKESVGYPIELSKYPYDEKWNVVSSHPSWKQEDSIHQLITQRQTSEGNIKDELMRIDQICRKIYPVKETDFILRLKDVINRYRYQHWL